MHIVLWIVQVLLALAFFGAGAMKLVTPMDELLANGMAFVEHSPTWLVRFIGVSEVLGAIGLIAPAATRIKPVLTPVAALSLLLVMALGVLTHFALGDAAGSVGAIVLGLLSAFVAWGRLKKHPIKAR